MTQTVPAAFVLGSSKTGLTIGYRVLNADRTTYSAFTTTGVSETGVSGTYAVSGGVVVPDAGGYIVAGESGTDYAEAPVDPKPLPATDYTTPPTTTAIADAVWDEVAADHTTAGTTGESLDTAASGAGGGATAADVWAYATRTLTQGAAAVAAAVDGADVTVYRGTTWSVTLTGLPNLDTYDTVYLSVKRRLSDTDDEALLRVSDSVGLERFNGATATAGNATLTRPSSTSITVTVDETVADDAPLVTGYVYDVKGVDDDGNVDLLSIGGAWTVAGDVTRAVT